MAWLAAANCVIVPVRAKRDSAPFGGIAGSAVSRPAKAEPAGEGDHGHPIFRRDAADVVRQWFD
jgi:hypothetical protein